MRNSPTPNSGPMADVAFTLLIFFLVSTTLATDKGERVKLPRFIECDDCDVQEHPDDLLLSVDILPDNQILLEGEPFSGNLTQETIAFMTLGNYEDRIVRVRVHQDANYETYLRVYSEVKSGFTTLRRQKSIKMYGQELDQVPQEQYLRIVGELPLKIVEQTVDQF